MNSFKLFNRNNKHDIANNNYLNSNGVDNNTKEKDQFYSNYKNNLQLPPKYSKNIISNSSSSSSHDMNTDDKKKVNSSEGKTNECDETNNDDEDNKENIKVNLNNKTNVEESKGKSTNKKEKSQRKSKKKAKKNKKEKSKNKKGIFNQVNLIRNSLGGDNGKNLSINNNEVNEEVLSTNTDLDTKKRTSISQESSNLIDDKNKMSSAAMNSMNNTSISSKTPCDLEKVNPPIKGKLHKNESEKSFTIVSKNSLENESNINLVKCFMDEGQNSKENDKCIKEKTGKNGKTDPIKNVKDNIICENTFKMDDKDNFIIGNGVALTNTSITPTNNSVVHGYGDESLNNDTINSSLIYTNSIPSYGHNKNLSGNMNSFPDTMTSIYQGNTLNSENSLFQGNISNGAMTFNSNISNGGSFVFLNNTSSSNPAKSGENDEREISQLKDYNSSDNSKEKQIFGNCGDVNTAKLNEKKQLSKEEKEQLKSKKNGKSKIKNKAKNKKKEKNDAKISSSTTNNEINDEPVFSSSSSVSSYTNKKRYLDVTSPSTSVDEKKNWFSFKRLFNRKSHRKSAGYYSPHSRSFSNDLDYNRNSLTNNTQPSNMMIYNWEELKRRMELEENSTVCSESLTAREFADAVGIQIITSDDENDLATNDTSYSYNNRMSFSIQNGNSKCSTLFNGTHHSTKSSGPRLDMSIFIPPEKRTGNANNSTSTEITTTTATASLAPPPSSNTKNSLYSLSSMCEQNNTLDLNNRKANEKNNSPKISSSSSSYNKRNYPDNNIISSLTKQTIKEDTVSPQGTLKVENNENYSQTSLNNPKNPTFLYSRRPRISSFSKGQSLVNNESDDKLLPSDSKTKNSNIKSPSQKFLFSVEQENSKTVDSTETVIASESLHSNYSFDISENVNSLNSTNNKMGYSSNSIYRNYRNNRSSSSVNVNISSRMNNDNEYSLKDNASLKSINNNYSSPGIYSSSFTPLNKDINNNNNISQRNKEVNGSLKRNSSKPNRVILVNNDSNRDEVKIKGQSSNGNINANKIVTTNSINSSSDVLSPNKSMVSNDNNGICQRINGVKQSKKSPSISSIHSTKNTSPLISSTTIPTKTYIGEDSIVQEYQRGRFTVTKPIHTQSTNHHRRFIVTKEEEDENGDSLTTISSISSSSGKFNLRKRSSSQPAYYMSSDIDYRPGSSSPNKINILSKYNHSSPHISDLDSTSIPPSPIVSASSPFINHSLSETYSSPDLSNLNIKHSNSNETYSSPKNRHRSVTINLIDTRNSFSKNHLHNTNNNNSNSNNSSIPFSSSSLSRGLKATTSSTISSSHNSLTEKKSNNDVRQQQNINNTHSNSMSKVDDTPSAKNNNKSLNITTTNYLSSQEQLHTSSPHSPLSSTSSTNPNSRFHVTSLNRNSNNNSISPQNTPLNTKVLIDSSNASNNTKINKNSSSSSLKSGDMVSSITKANTSSSCGGSIGNIGNDLNYHHQSPLIINHSSSLPLISSKECPTTPSSINTDYDKNDYYQLQKYNQNYNSIYLNNNDSRGNSSETVGKISNGHRDSSENCSDNLYDTLENRSFHCLMNNNDQSLLYNIKNKHSFQPTSSPSPGIASSSLMDKPPVIPKSSINYNISAIPLNHSTEISGKINSTIYASQSNGITLNSRNLNDNSELELSHGSYNSVNNGKSILSDSIKRSHDVVNIKNEKANVNSTNINSIDYSQGNSSNSMDNTSVIPMATTCNNNDLDNNLNENSFSNDLSSHKANRPSISILHCRTPSSSSTSSRRFIVIRDNDSHSPSRSPTFFNNTGSSPNTLNSPSISHYHHHSNSLHNNSSNDSIPSLISSSKMPLSQVNSNDNINKNTNNNNNRNNTNNNNNCNSTNSNNNTNASTSTSNSINTTNIGRFTITRETIIS